MDFSIIDSLLISLFLSVFAHYLSLHLISSLKQLFTKAGLHGRDMNKANVIILPEALGLLCATAFLISVFLFIPLPFLTLSLVGHTLPIFPKEKLTEFVAACLSICCMVLLGFADDVLNLRWKYKLVLPALSCLPLMTVYYSVSNNTWIRLPSLSRIFDALGIKYEISPSFSPLSSSFASVLLYIYERLLDLFPDRIHESVNIGILYYIMMASLAIFYTNSINILAGINGLEVGQAMVIGSSILLNNIYQLVSGETPYPGHLQHHLLSIFLILPFLGCCTAIWTFNRYPSQVFVGDTFCYFSGMVFAVVSILGHFSKTCCLFFLPQLINFGYSVPQLFKFIPCPRHRLPRMFISPRIELDVDSGDEKINGDIIVGEEMLEMSLVCIDTSEWSTVAKSFLLLASNLKLIFLTSNIHDVHPSQFHAPNCSLPGDDVVEDNKSHEKHATTDHHLVFINNLTLINLFLFWFGPMKEEKLTNCLILFQVLCSLLGFVIRYYLVSFIYPD